MKTPETKLEALLRAAAVLEGRTVGPWTFRVVQRELVLSPGGEAAARLSGLADRNSLSVTVAGPRLDEDGRSLDVESHVVGWLEEAGVRAGVDVRDDPGHLFHGCLEVWPTSLEGGR